MTSGCTYSDYILASVLKEVKEKNLLFKVLSRLQQGEGRNSNERIVQLYEDGCLKEVIANVQGFQDLDTLSLNLSILAVCCTKQICTEEAITKHNLLLHLSNLLSNYKHDDIQRKVFRIIKNICQHSSYYDKWDALHEINFANTIIEQEPQLHIIAKIIAYLEMVANVDDEPSNLESKSRNKPSETTIIIAIHVLRELTSTNSIPAMWDCEILKTLGMLIIKYTPVWENTKNHENILRIVLNLTLKFVCSISHRKKDEVILKLENTDKGNALIHLGKLLPLLPYAVVKITVILSELNPRTSALPVNDIFQGLLELLEDPGSFTYGREDFKHQEYLNYLCLLTRHPDVLKEEGFVDSLIPVFLNILRDYTKTTHSSLPNCALIISTLTEQCSSFSLLDHGFIDVLSEKLDFVLESGFEINTLHDLKFINHSYHRLHKRVKFVSDFSQCSPNGHGEDCEDYCCGYNSDHHSMQSDDDSERRFDIDKPETFFCGSATLRKKLSNEIINFIKPLVVIRNVARKMISSNLLTKMLQYFLPSAKSCCTGDVIKIVLLITQNPEYRLEIMQTDFIIEASKFKRRPHDSRCDTCTTLNKIGEYILWTFTKFVEDDKESLRKDLDCASRLVQQKIVSAIPFLTRYYGILSYFMLTCRGLNVMLESLNENSTVQDLNIQKRCIKGLCAVAEIIGLKNSAISHFDVIDFKYCNFPTIIQQNDKEENVANIVRFKLDDGTFVEGNREFLSQISEYFNRLLCGEFKESYQQEIHIHNVSNESFKCLLNFLHCDIINKKPYRLEIELDVLLEVIGLANRYLLEELCFYLTKHVQYLKFDPITVPMIYQWSLESNTGILREEAVVYALVKSMDESKRFDMFKNFLQLECSECFIDDIRKLLTKCLF